MGFLMQQSLLGNTDFIPVWFFFVDPSLTVRADITGRYSNRLYAYEPSDIPLCKYYFL